MLFRSKIEECKDNKIEMNRYYKLLAMLAPDCSYAWVNRSSTVKSLDTSSLEEELRWLNVLQMLHVKSGDAWSHRRLVLTCMMYQTNESLLNSELDFIAIQAERHPHHYYAMNHFNWLSPSLTDSVAVPFLQKMIAITPLHYGVYHHLLRRMKDTPLSVILEIVNTPECYRTSESFCQFVYVAAMQCGEKFPAFAALQGDAKWQIYFRNLVLDL